MRKPKRKKCVQFRSHGVECVSIDSGRKGESLSCRSRTLGTTGKHKEGKSVKHRVVQGTLCARIDTAMLRRRLFSSGMTGVSRKKLPPEHSHDCPHHGDLMQHVRCTNHTACQESTQQATFLLRLTRPSERKAFSSERADKVASLT